MLNESWIVLDTETSGLNIPIHVVEIAAQKMRGWERDGESFRVLLNHDVPIDPAAEALHGYSRKYLRQHGRNPLEAHAAFRAYGQDFPLVAFNLSFDWDRVLVPEYGRLRTPPTGCRGFCALTLARRTIQETRSFRLENLKNLFRLSTERSHTGWSDVEVLTKLLQEVIRPRLAKAGVSGFSNIAAFARKTPVAACLERVAGTAASPAKRARS